MKHGLAEHTYLTIESLIGGLGLKEALNRCGNEPKG